MFSAILSPLTIFMSLSTATGVLVHDMHIDSAATAAFAMPSVLASYENNNKLSNLGGDAHTHVERGSLAQAVTELRNQNPRIQPRASGDKKYLLQNRVMRGHHAFDNYNLPIV